jgi:hypothetical protein
MNLDQASPVVSSAYVGIIQINYMNSELNIESRNADPLKPTLRCRIKFQNRISRHLSRYQRVCQILLDEVFPARTGERGTRESRPIAERTGEVRFFSGNAVRAVH